MNRTQYYFDEFLSSVTQSSKDKSNHRIQYEPHCASRHITFVGIRISGQTNVKYIPEEVKIGERSWGIHILMKERLNKCYHSEMSENF